VEVARPVRRATARKPPAEKADPAPRRRPYLAREPIVCRRTPAVRSGAQLTWTRIGCSLTASLSGKPAGGADAATAAIGPASDTPGSVLAGLTFDQLEKEK
jgi:hypothetical protein